MARMKMVRMKIVTINLPVEFLEFMNKHENFNCPSRSEFIRVAVRNQIIEELRLERVMRGEGPSSCRRLEIEQIEDVPIFNGSHRGKKEPLGNIYYPKGMNEEMVPEPILKNKTYKIVKRLE